MSPESTQSVPKKAVSRIADLREAAGFTQAELAVFVGVTTNTIQNWETGKSGVDQIEKFLKLCTILGCDFPDLVEYVPNLESKKPKKGKFSLDDLREMRRRWWVSSDDTTTARSLNHGEE